VPLKMQGNIHDDKLSLPGWFRQGIPNQAKTKKVKDILSKFNLNTVCQSALCPNSGKCWEKGVATFMILGDVCTRNCKFCAVSTGLPKKVDSNEPQNIARAVKELKLKYVVITSVTRDDLPDKGASQFISVVKAIKELCPETKVEILIPDFGGEFNLISEVAFSGAEVIAHNIEMVKSLYKAVRPKSDYDCSLKILSDIKRANKEVVVKSGFMVGLGETKDAVYELISEIAKNGCEILTIGQYLAPTDSLRHVKVKKYVSPEEFDFYKDKAYELGIKYVFSSPLVRSSFLAEEGFNALQNRRQPVKCS